MSINQLLEIGRRSLQAYQAAMNTTGQNIANVETEGYSRRQVDLESNRTSPGGLNVGVVGREALGTGSSVQDIRRVQDRLLSRAHLEATTGHHTAEEEHRLVSNLEGVFPTSEGGSLNDQLSAFWNSWEELANYPTDKTVRQGVLSRARTLTSTMNRVASGIDRIQSETKSEIQNGVDEVNDLLTRIAGLNEKIQAGEATGAKDLEAMDERERLLGKLSEKVPVEVQERENEYAVLIQGKTVVQGKEITELTADTSGTTASVSFQNSDATFDYSGNEVGELGARLHVFNDTLADAETRMNDLASNLVQAVNDIHNDANTSPHKSGSDNAFEQDGTTAAGDFFTPGNTTAASIQVHQDIRDDPTRIAASDTSGESGNNQVALAIGGLRNTDLAGLGSESANNFTSNLLSDIGSEVQSARTRSEAEATAADHVKALKDGTEGVSLNEEMTNLIEYQQAFAASARIVQNARQMSETLMSI